MKEHIFLALKDNLLKIFLGDKILIGSEIMHYDNSKVIKNIYDGFCTIVVDKIITLICIPETRLNIMHSDFIEVTSNKIFDISNILAGSIFKANTVIEGGDGVGKSTLVSNLAQLGIICQDRAVKEITKKMKPEVVEDERLYSLQHYLNADRNRKVIFIYISDERELEKRIYSREIITEYDKKSVIFQRLYVDSYKKLKGQNSNLFLIDALNKSREDIVKEVMNIIC